MGQEIAADHFRAEARALFDQRLAEETALLRSALASGSFSSSGFVAGCELEAWLIDRNLFPAPNNEAFLAHLDHPLVVPELSRFNVELNSTPQALHGNALLRMESELEQTWRYCMKKAHDLDNALILIGILPTVREQDLCLANISPLNRFSALNTEVIKLRGGRPIQINISGEERLALSQMDVMLEAAATSFQVHLQIPVEKAVRYYNASLMLCAPLAAATANSPFLFQHTLWEETRIPLFEQAVNLGDQAAERVTFGSGYLESSVWECFEENLKMYEALLPIQFDTPPAHFDHLRLHNGTIWRWSRPLIGFDNAGQPHVRIEQRVMAAGPSILDQVASAAFYFGAVHYLAEQIRPPETDLLFSAAHANFYRAAQYGLEATLDWPGERHMVNAASLILDELLPIADYGLTMLGIDRDSRRRYLNIVEARVKSRQTGAAWQRAYLNDHDRNFFDLTAKYLENQRSGAPVHEWNV